jgi:intracellular sulfur oxidation DsrE/DsrF family protein
MKMFKLTLLVLAAILASACATTGPRDDGVHKVVIQVSTDDPRTQTIALNNAVNLQKALGPGNVMVEIVAYGPGLSLLTRKSRQAKRVQGLAMSEDLTFSACGNTMKKIKRKKGRTPKLVDGVRVVPAGVVRIMELQEQGYAYIRP